MTRPIEAFVAKLGLPSDPPDPRFREALTHASAEGGINYERLEFLGDAVLKLVVSRWLYRDHPGLNEGAMTVVRARAVSDETLARVADDLELGAHLILGNSEKRSAGRRKVGILASAFEAVLGAVYLSAGEDAADAFLARWLGPELARSLELAGAENAKALLQEHAQKLAIALPDYQLVDSHGPPHERLYVVAVALNGQELGRGEGTSKKAAEQAAATEAMATIRTRQGGKK